MTVTVSMPYRGTPQTVHRAVRSVLDQSYRDLRLVVVNDGAGLVRFDLPANRGRYYADAVVLAAAASPLWMVHDSDDFTDRRHIRQLVDALGTNDAAFAGYERHTPSGRGTVTLPRIDRVDAIRHITHYGSVLWRTDALRSLGGPNPGWTIAYDTFLLALAARRLRCVAVPDATYHHVIRGGSLTQARATKIGSSRRRGVQLQRQRLWRAVKDLPIELVAAKLRPLSPVVKDVAADADRLRALL